MESRARRLRSRDGIRRECGSAAIGSEIAIGHRTGTANGIEMEGDAGRNGTAGKQRVRPETPRSDNADVEEKGWRGMERSVEWTGSRHTG